MDISNIFYVIAIVYMVFTMSVLLVLLVYVYRVSRYILKVKTELVQKLQIVESLRYSMQFEVLQKVFQFLRGKRKGGDRR